jgi:hypothetical protein
MDVTQETTPPCWSLTMASGAPVGLQIIGPEDLHTTYQGMFIIKNCDGILLNKQLKSLPALTIKTTAGETLPVITMAQHTTVFGSHKLKSNVSYVSSEPPPLASPAPPLTSPTPPPPQMSSVPKVKKLKKPTVSGLGTGDLSQHVAKQLFELAVLKKEQCPITVEEFSPGNTAVMPCGHLFMQMAIEESFKKDANKCPWCRQLGRPTYV